jgi:hypothetical protein
MTQQNHAEYVKNLVSELGGLESKIITLKKELEETAKAADEKAAQIARERKNYPKEIERCVFCGEIPCRRLVLSCGHGFCKLCYSGWKKSASGYEKDLCPNPLCRKYASKGTCGTEVIFEIQVERPGDYDNGK